MILESIIRQLHPDAYRWSLTLCQGNKELAEDILQDVYLKIWERKAVFSEKSMFRTWLFALIRNTAVDHFRIHKNVQVLELKEAMLVEDKFPAEESDSDVWEHLLQRLSNMQRATLQLVFYHGCTLEEASAILNIAPGTTSTHFKRAKGNMKKMIMKLRLREKKYE